MLQIYLWMLYTAWMDVYKIKYLLKNENLLKTAPEAKMHLVVEFKWHFNMI